MYLERAIFINRAPFEHLDLNFKEKGINVLTAINGRGKTTVLSHIVDAFYELAKKQFKNEFEGRENKYYRVSSALYNVDMFKPSYVYLRFKDSGQKYDYIDIRNTCSEEEYNQNITIENKIDYNRLKSSLKMAQNIKYWEESVDQKVKDLFNHNLMTYFPSYRYEEPCYLNDPYSIKLNFSKTYGFSGTLKNPIEVVSDIYLLTNWFLDVLLDMKQNEKIEYIDNNGQIIPFSVPSKEQQFVWDNLNLIISSALYSKHYNGKVRLGIGPRRSGGSRIVIVNDENNNSHKQICPSIFSLSSGELSLISLFGEVLHQADNNQNNIQRQDINGIVLIDEVDKHLHISIQKEILPKLFNLFPNVQFIVSSHSPFLNMGLAEICSENNKIFDLDNYGLACSATINNLYKEVYEMMIKENNRFAADYKKLKEDIAKLTKPIVITEGKTDIKHILKAKEKLSISDIDFDVIEKDKQPDGDSNLQKLLEQLSHISNKNKIIGIFDRDLQKTVSVIENDHQPYKDYGNNVYAICIPLPQSRSDKGQCSISIEYLYSDDEIRSTLPNGNQLFFGSDFSEMTGKNINNRNLTLCNQSERGKDKIVENNGGQAVYDANENNILAKKDDFAEAITQESITINNESWSNFKPIFDKIRDILNL